MQLANMEVNLFWHTMLARCSFALEKDHVAGHVQTPIGTVTGKVSLRCVERSRIVA